MPFPRTRARFIDHQRAIRPGDAQAQILQEWNLKTPAQRANWVAGFDAAVVITHRAQAQQDVAYALVHRVDNQNLNAVALLTDWQQYSTFFRRIGRARKALQSLAAGHARAEQVWRNLNDEESTHAGVHPVSLFHDIIQENAARGSQNLARTEDLRLEGIRARPPVPLDAARNVHRMREDWISRRDEKLIQSRRLPMDIARIAGQVGLNDPATGPWVCWRDFEGGMSRGSLWLNFDADDVLVDRVFRKDVFQDRAAWKDPSQWHGDVRNLVSRTPMESRCHTLLEGGLEAGGPLVPPVQGVVRLREPHRLNFVDNYNAKYRLYLEFCPYGDLHHLVQESFRHNLWIPEPFVWCVAEALVTSGLQMFQGSDPPSQPSWEEMVHRDYKLANVFLGKENENIYPDYAQPLLGDFGLAFTTPRVPHGTDPVAVDRLNPRWYQGQGTITFMAPEQHHWVDQTHRNAPNPYVTLDDFQIRQPTNVFGVGTILWCLVNRMYEPPINLWLGDATTNQTYAMSPDAIARYDNQLLQIILSCLRYDPSTRPTFALLDQLIQDCTSDDPTRPIHLDLTGGLRSGNADVPTIVAGNIVHLIQPNGYLDGMARDEVPH